MIRLGLRLVASGGREAAVRLVATAIAVALGVGLLLVTLSAINAVNTQNARYAWITTGLTSSATETTETAETADVDPLWWRIKSDKFDAGTIGRIDVAATGPDSPVPPGMADLPGPGEFYVSPALGDLIADTPAAELGDRYPGQQVGTIGDEALPAPDSLIVVIGHSADEMAALPDATQVTAIETTTPSSCSGDCPPIGVNADSMAVILAVTAGALLFPMLIFIGTATRLAAARREQRFAAMRLVGATPRQVSVISAVESTVVAAAGVVGAFGIFWMLRAPVAAIPFTGAPFFTNDLSLNPTQIGLVALGVPIAAAIASRVALRRVQISPLGVTRRVTPTAPKAWRLLPLLAGIGELAVVVVVGRPDTTNAQIGAYAPGFILTMIGLVLAGPWFTMVGARRMARRTSRPAALIAGQRLSDNPKAGFRAISGLVLALFVGSVAIGAMTSYVAERSQPGGGEASSSTLTQAVYDPGESMPPLDSATRTALEVIDGVEGVATIHKSPLGDMTVVGDFLVPAGLVSCAELAGTPALGRCEPGAEVATIPDHALGPWDAEQADAGWPAADVAITNEQLDDLPLVSLAVATDGSTSAIESARTILEDAYPDVWSPTTITELSDEDQRIMKSWQQLANVVVATSLVIAGCSLAVSVAAGLLDRKRPFSLLRLTGVPLGVLRQVVALESVVPLLIVAAVSTATGFLAAHLFLRVQLDYSLRPPTAEYYVVVIAGLVASLAVIASTLPLLDRVTGPETARNE